MWDKDLILTCKGSTLKRKAEIRRRSEGQLGPKTKTFINRKHLKSGTEIMKEPGHEKK